MNAPVNETNNNPRMPIGQPVSRGLVEYLELKGECPKCEMTATKTFLFKNPDIVLGIWQPFRCAYCDTVFAVMFD